MKSAITAEENPTSWITIVENAAGVTAEGGWPITDSQSVEQLGDVLGATSTAELIAPDPRTVEPGLVDQALEAVNAAIASNCPEPNYR